MEKTTLTITYNANGSLWKPLYILLILSTNFDRLKIYISIYFVCRYIIYTHNRVTFSNLKKINSFILTHIYLSNLTTYTRLQTHYKHIYPVPSFLMAGHNLSMSNIFLDFFFFISPQCCITKRQLIYYSETCSLGQHIYKTIKIFF